MPQLYYGKEVSYRFLYILLYYLEELFISLLYVKQFKKCLRRVCVCGLFSVAVLIKSSQPRNRQLLAPILLLVDTRSTQAYFCLEYSDIFLGIIAYLFFLLFFQS